MGTHAPREPLHERVERLVRDRRVRMVFVLGLGGGLLQVASSSMQLGVWWPFALSVCFVVVMLIVARVVAIRREKASMAARKATLHILSVPTGWPQLDEAIAGYRALSGGRTPNVGVKLRRDVGERVDAELAFFGSVRDERGVFPVVSPFAATAEDVPWCAFNEPMLDTYAASELLAVMVHLMYRGEFARGESARLSNGVCEADSKTLLLTREHVPLLRAIEMVTADRPTPAPGTGSIHFSDRDLRAAHVTSVGLVKGWATRDRVDELRAHLGALSLDVPG